MTTRSKSLAGEIPSWLSGGLIFGTLAAAMWYERRRPLRRQTRSDLIRDARNFAMAAMSAAAISVFEKPAVAPLSRRVHGARRGLLPRLNLPVWAEVAAAVVLMDYTLYVWHVLTHKVPLLARFHRVHHADADMDASTAARFHFGEMILSVPWRMAQVALIGVSPLALSAWQTLTTMAIFFHHSNSRLPLRLERLLSRVLVTPRMHGIHHSVIQDETDSNWSTIFSWPDYLHRTIRLNVPQDRIKIGLPTIRREEELTLPKLIAMPLAGGPLKAQRPARARTRPERTWPITSIPSAG